MMIAFVMGTAVSAWGSVSLSAFPDPVFREHLRQYDYGWGESDSNGKIIGRHNGILEDKELEKITNLGLNGKITSLK